MTEENRSHHRGPAQLPVAELLAQCQVQRTRRGGPGGQHRNKVESAVVITHVPSGVSGQASERRDQSRNLAVAIQRLRIRLALAVRSAIAGESMAKQPNELWKKYIRSQSIRINVENPDFPALLSEMLDLLAVEGGDPKRVGEWIGITSSQVVKFLKIEPEALELVNRWRETKEAGKLR